MGSMTSIIRNIIYIAKFYTSCFILNDLITDGVANFKSILGSVKNHF